MRILVTGGAGFIGSHLVDRLLQLGHRVTALDNVSTGRVSNLRTAYNDSNFRFRKGTILNRNLIGRLVREHEVVFHLAAVVGVKQCLDAPLDLIATNIHGTENIVESCHRWNRKLILASTSEVYGKRDNVPFHEDSDREFGPTRSERWLYAITKSLDEYLTLVHTKSGLRATVVRYFNIYGPRAESSPYPSVIPIFLQAALSHKPLPIHGTGNQTRCFTYVDDCVEATISAMHHAADGEFVNVGSEQEISISELADRVIKLTDSKSSLLYLPYEQVYGVGYEDVGRRVPDLNNARRILGYEPKISLELGLQKTIEWYTEKTIL